MNTVNGLWCEHCGWRGLVSEAAAYVGQLDEYVCPECDHYGTVNEVSLGPADLPALRLPAHPEIAFALEGLRQGVITPNEAADRIEALLALRERHPDRSDDSRPPDEDQIRLKCNFWAPGPGLCGWTGPASEAGWCDHFQEWICPRCGASEGLGIIESKALPACVECRCPAQGTLPCGHPICDDCYEGLYQDGCAACNGHASWCRFSTEPPDTRPVHPIPDVAPDDHLEAAYEGRTELQHD